MRDLVKEITKVFGPAGDEALIREYITKTLKAYADDITTDALGNLIVYKKGISSDKKLMFAAHMDTIGLMLTHIEDNGCIRFAKLGGVYPNVLANQKVIFKNGTEGTVAFEGKDCTSTGPLEKFYIDIGTLSKEETLKLVNVGDTCVYNAVQADLANNMISTMYLDNRLSCAVLINALKTAKNVKYDTYCVFTTQEEVGLRGAKAAAFGIMPDIGIAIDGTIAGDTINPVRKMDVKLSSGPAIKIKDSSVICSPEVRNMLMGKAKEIGIPYQLEILEAGGTDTSAIQMTGAGIPAGCVSIPLRYVHTMSETASLDDANNAVKLIARVIEDGADL